MSMTAAAFRANASKPKANKYGAKRTTVDGTTFDSKGEARRFAHLQTLQLIGEIHGLERQVPFPLLAPNGTVIGVYKADAVYFVGTRFVAEDFKAGPTKTPLFRWKAKHLKAQEGIDLWIVESPSAAVPSDAASVPAPTASDHKTS